MRYYLQRQKDEQLAHVSLLERIRASKSSDLLVVAFSGGATNKIGLARLNSVECSQSTKGSTSLRIGSNRDVLL